MMIYYKLGDVIRELRNRCHLTQEELAAGICSVSSVAKIEGGSQMPSGRVAEALLRKLGDVGCFFTGFSQEGELRELYFWEETKRRANRDSRGESQFEKQFYAYVRLLDEMHDHTEHSVTLLELMQVLVMSMPLAELNDGCAERQTYTYLELYILNSIAVQYYYMESYEYAARVLERLYAYLQKWHMQGEVSRYLFPVVCSNLATVRLKCGLLQPARISCDMGIRRCLNSGMLLPLPSLYGTLSRVLFALQDAEGAQNAYSRMMVLSDLLNERERLLAPAELELLGQGCLLSLV